MIPISHTLILSAILFALGATGFLIRRNIITVFLCIELMLNGVALTFVTFFETLGRTFRPSLRLFHYYGGGGRSGRRAGHYHGCFPLARFAQYRRDRFDEILNTNAH